MAFRKRNIVVGHAPTEPAPPSGRVKDISSGVKPSLLTSNSVTSTGTPSLDALLGGHGGLALGSSLLVEESGTTDFAGALLRYFAAEGICHGHVVHVVGVGESWARELPGVAEERSSQSKSSSLDGEKMKIAWRYETLGQRSERALSNGSQSNQTPASVSEGPFCHTFDLSKRLTIPQDARINHVRVSDGSRPFDNVIQQLEKNLETSATHIIHRVIIPTILSPAFHSPQASRPENFVRFLHSLRALLRKHPSTLTAMITLPLELFPRDSGLVRWAEILSDGVLELTPFPHLMDASSSLAESGGARSNEEQPQGMVKFYKLPINTERGEGGAGVGNSTGEDLAFTISRRKFAIKPFSLPPLEGDQDAQKEAGKLTGKNVEF